MRPLEDVRIIAVEQYGAGPWASLQLADLGAEVIKIEDPGTGGDVGRYVPPYAGDRDSLFFQAFNRNKQSIALDLTTEAGRSVLHDLVAQSDALISNLRGDVPARLGLLYDDVKVANPSIVCCSLSAYGMTGPRAADPGYDYVIQGLTGWMSLTGDPDGPPTKTGLSLVDFAGGYVAAISLLAGIHEARRTGIGMDCDVSLFDTAVSLLNYVGTWTLSRDEYEPPRTHQSAHPSIVPFQAFETADGWIMIACAKQKFWLLLTQGMGLESLATDDRFVGFAERYEHREELLATLARRFKERGTAAWVETLQGLGVPCGPVNDVRGAFDDAHVAARDLVMEYELDHLGTVRTPRTAARVGDAVPGRAPGPRLAEHRDTVLQGLLGYTPSDIETLQGQGAFGDSE